MLKRLNAWLESPIEPTEAFVLMLRFCTVVYALGCLVFLVWKLAA